MLPTFLISFMEITPFMMENKTMGTTMNFSRFRNRVPKGLMYISAMSGRLINSMPATIPNANPVKIHSASGFFFIHIIPLF